MKITTACVLVAAAVGITCTPLGRATDGSTRIVTERSSAAERPMPVKPTAATREDAEEARRVLTTLASWLEIPQSELRVAEVQSKSWPDDCGDMHPLQREADSCRIGPYTGVDVTLEDSSGTRYHAQAIRGHLPLRIAAATASGRVVEGSQDHLLLRNESGDHEFATGRGGRLLSQEPHGEPVIGREVVIGYDPGGSTSAFPVVVWIALKR